MVNRLLQRLRFLLERFIVRGPQNRLLVVAALIGLVSVAAGLVVYVAGSFDRLGPAIWWAFLRLSDPGYLGDDEGALLRTVSTVVTVLGYVLFLGALVAIMTQWFNVRMRNLEQGLTPVAQSNHIVILGWTTRTPGIMRELLRSDKRVRRFLRGRGGRRLRIVLLTEDVSAERVQDLRDRLGPDWSSRRILLRSGNPLRLEHLRRVDCRNASAIIIPGTDFGEHGLDAADTQTIKVLLSIASSAQSDASARYPLLVAEIFDARRVAAASGIYDGRVEVVSSELIIARLMAQTIRHPGLSDVYAEILAYGEGNRIYLQEGTDLAGVPSNRLLDAFPVAVVLGLVRPDGADFRPLLDPSLGDVVEPEDRIVLLAASDADAEPRPELVRAATVPVEGRDRTPARSIERRVLVLGWSFRVPALLEELAEQENERFEIVIASVVPTEQREAVLARRPLPANRIQLSHCEADFTVPSDLRALHPASYDSIVLVANDRLPSGEEADARSVLGHVLLRRDTRQPGGPHVVVELTDPENEELIESAATDVLVSPILLSHMLSQVALRRELQPVFDELFGSGGAEILFRSAGEYGMVGAHISFLEVQHAAAARGETALGIRRPAAPGGRGEVHLNPPRDRLWRLTEQDDLVVLAAQ